MKATLASKKQRAFLKWAGYSYDKFMKCERYDFAFSKSMKTSVGQIHHSYFELLPKVTGIFSSEVCDV